MRSVEGKADGTKSVKGKAVNSVEGEVLFHEKEGKY